MNKPTSAQKAMNFSKNVTAAILPPRFVPTDYADIADPQFISATKAELAKRLGWKLDTPETNVPVALEGAEGSGTHKVPLQTIPCQTGRIERRETGVAEEDGSPDMDAFIAELDKEERKHEN